MRVLCGVSLVALATVCACSASPAPQYSYRARASGAAGNERVTAVQTSAMSRSERLDADLSRVAEDERAAPAAITPRRMVIVTPPPRTPQGRPVPASPAPAPSPVSVGGVPDAPGAGATNNTLPPARDTAALSGSIRGLEDRITRGEDALSSSGGECATVCRAAGDICAAARELCELTDALAGAPGDARCTRARDACDRAARTRESACPVCPSL